VEELENVLGHEGVDVAEPGGQEAGDGFTDLRDGQPGKQSSQVARLWDVGTARPLAVFQGHTDELVSVALSADGKILATGSKDQSIMVWDVPAQK
jgi:WD40 repeat protein